MRFLEMNRLGVFTPRRETLLVGLLVFALMMTGCAKKVAPPVEGDVVVPEGGHFLDHTVAEGETLAQVADNYYGDPGVSARIAKDNGVADPERIIPGSLLRLRFNDDEWESARQRSAALVPYNRGVDLLANERLAEAEKQFSLALDTAPDLVAAKYNLALVLLKRGKTEQALVLLEELTALRPTETDFLFARGNALFQSTRFDEAAEQFQAALDVDPKLKRAAFGFARSLQEGQHTDRAITAWKRYLELDGTSSWAAAARRNLKMLQDEGDS
jgi:tetratricopeptide (TPR) repeat protein